MKLIIGYIFIGIGLFLTSGMLLSIIDGESTLKEDSPIWLFIILPLIVSGVLNIYYHYKRLKINSKEQLENELLTIVLKENGVITVAKLAASSTLTLSNAEKALEDFAKRGVASRKITESGIIVYEFLTIGSKEDQSTAKSI
ncbi:hypothetical protein ACFSCX_00680 [Bacillus salitolerans]|uniref:MarR family transcriptional regulator n=1 Tax=Bacillus salitolerans TaxID=1437434 RepID=A0ABW4LII9_9BACI